MFFIPNTYNYICVVDLHYLPASGFWKKDCTNFVMADHCSGVGDDIVYGS